ncbi:hypothetical protein PR202_gb13432 [Eleusine coracana subsp. coracana]|uniref:NB-ARC domain-containing protein n=1 Tax=Eleusine coracana subsp. coracana TaxID=191504 RepID=A0AAV5ESM6_ELECO|nr:hypothetical protein PR202_gb13432 [Eleusine coracana subsp. coracana]
MELATGALPSVLAKLSDLLVGEYKLPKGLMGKEEITFLQAELENMHGTLEEFAARPAHRVEEVQRFWAWRVKDLSYDIEDIIDTFMVGGKGGKLAKPHVFKKFIERSHYNRNRYLFIVDDIWDILSWKKIICALPINNGGCVIITTTRFLDIAEQVGRPYKLKPLSLDDSRILFYKRISGNEDNYIFHDEELAQVSHRILEKCAGVPLSIIMVTSLLASKGWNKTECFELYNNSIGTDHVMPGANVSWKRLRSVVAFPSSANVVPTLQSFKVLRVLDLQDCSISKGSALNYLGNLFQLSKRKLQQEDLEILGRLPALRHLRLTVDHENIGIIGKFVVATGSFPCLIQCELIGFIIPVLFQQGAMSRLASLKFTLLVRGMREIADRDCGFNIGLGNLLSLQDVTVFLNRGNASEKDVDQARAAVMQAARMHPFIPIFRFEDDTRDVKCHWEEANVGITHVTEMHPCDPTLQITADERDVQSHGKDVCEQSDRYKLDDVISRPHRITTVYPSLLAQYMQPTELVGIDKAINEAIKILMEGYEVSNQQGKIVSLVGFVGLGKTTLAKAVYEKIREQFDCWGFISVARKTDMKKLFKSMLSQLGKKTNSPNYEEELDERHYIYELTELLHNKSLKYLGNLFHLRYLGLRDTGITQLSEEMGNLQSLQTLDVTSNEISSLPPTVVQLKDLMCLSIDSWTRVPNGIGSLTSLEELSMLCINDSTDLVEELVQLTELRMVGIDYQATWNVDSLEKSLVGCLHKLQKVQTLSLSVFGEYKLDSWVAPQHIRRLELKGCLSSPLQTWMNPSLLLDLSFLSMEVQKLRQEDLEILGRLPSLIYLDLEVCQQNLGRVRRFVVIVGDCSFPCLVQCMLRGYIAPVVFQQGAMPRLARLHQTLPLRQMRETADINGAFDLGLENLLSLQDATFLVHRGGTIEADVEEAQAALRHAIGSHPNHPALEIYTNDV